MMTLPVSALLRRASSPAGPGSGWPGVGLAGAVGFQVVGETNGSPYHPDRTGKSFVRWTWAGCGARHSFPVAEENWHAAKRPTPWPVHPQLAAWRRAGVVGAAAYMAA
ncbi:hypothetical protein GCM10008961_20440 [Deinococcus knuensis]|uniref:Transposase n=1 Tax=Deinococcus knuensis TaxID=1837380 RepID=A0ABQ2SHF1_9DEIO|nr:hypothetical protein GCM10008961_20440 [Deinococcus knuensis]